MMRAWITVIALAAGQSGTACGVVSVKPLWRGDELAVIVWNPATRTEHFIRRASFWDVRSDFAFLVPVPSLPTLSAVESPTPFRTMEASHERLRARVAEEKAGRLDIQLSCSPPVGSIDSMVISQRKVGDYETAVLKTEDPKIVGTWLIKNGFSKSPALDAWLKVYSEKSYYLVALKHAEAKGKKARLDLKEVRITFQTDKPFYPYREPQEESRGPVRSWRMMMVAPTPMEARKDNGDGFYGATGSSFSLKLSPEEVSGMASELGVADLSSSTQWHLSPLREVRDSSRGDFDLTWDAVEPAAGDLTPLDDRGKRLMSAPPTSLAYLYGGLWVVGLASVAAILRRLSKWRKEATDVH